MGMSCFYGGMLPEVSASGGPVLVERLGKVDLPGLYSDECKTIFLLDILKINSMYY